MRYGIEDSCVPQHLLLSAAYEAAHETHKDTDNFLVIVWIINTQIERSAW
jgi:hypothetical protein